MDLLTVASIATGVATAAPLIKSVIYCGPRFIWWGRTTCWPYKPWWIG